MGIHDGQLDICNGDLGLLFLEACPGQNNAMINLYVSSGTPPYIQWSNVKQKILKILTGLYTATVTDANGICATISRGNRVWYNFIFPSSIMVEIMALHISIYGCDCNTSFCQFIWVLDGDTSTR